MKISTCIPNIKKKGKLICNFAFFLFLCINTGCKKNEKNHEWVSLNALKLQANNNYALPVEINGRLKTFIRLNEKKDVKFYIGVENVNDSMIVFTFICQRKETQSKRIPSLFDIQWRGWEIGIITGYENVFVPTENIVYHLVSRHL